MALSIASLFEDESHARLREQARRFAEKAIAPHARAWEEAEEFPRELYGELAQTGLLGVGYPEEVGGAGGDVSHVLAACEELVLTASRSARSSGSAATASRCRRSSASGTRRADRALRAARRSAARRSRALAITEPGGGCDVAQPDDARGDATATRYVVDGRKTFITSGVPRATS